MKSIFFVFLVFFNFNFTTSVFSGEINLKAEDVVPYLIGDWHFKLGERTGARNYKPLFEDNSAEIEEYFDDLPILGRGFVQYSVADGTFSSALFFNVGENDFITGVFDQQNQTIIYRSAKPGNENLEIILHIIGSRHFEFNNFRTENGERTQVLHVDFYRVE